MIMNGKEYFQTDTVVLGMVMISITVLLTDLVMRIIERRLVVAADPIIELEGVSKRYGDMLALDEACVSRRASSW